jgi:hypothetical protein
VEQNEAYWPDFIIQLLTVSKASLTYFSLHVSHLVLQLPDFLAVIQVAPKLSFSKHLFILRTMRVIPFHRCQLIKESIAVFRKCNAYLQLQQGDPLF